MWLHYALYLRTAIMITVNCNANAESLDWYASTHHGNTRP